MDLLDDERSDDSSNNSPNGCVFRRRNRHTTNAALDGSSHSQHLVYNYSDTSLMYSEEDVASVVVSPNDDIDADDDDGSTCISDLVSTHHYFDHDSSDDEGRGPYIFTDEENYSSDDNHNNATGSSSQPPLFCLPRELAHHNSSNHNPGACIRSPKDWSNYNKRRGRLLAQHLLFKLRTKQQQEEEEDSQDDDDEEEENLRASAPADSMMLPSASHQRHHKASFLGRAVRKLRRSSRPRKMVHKLTTTDTSASSLSTTRNHQADFGSWERRVKYPKQPNAKWNDLLLDLIESSESTCSSGSHDGNSCLLPSPVVLTSLQCGILPRQPTISTTALDCRATSEDVAVQLGLPAPQSTAVLKRLRGTAGVFDEDDDDDDEAHDNHAAQQPQQENDNGRQVQQVQPRQVQLLHILDGLWIPHFEEYVFRTVHAFGRRLCAS